MVTSTPAATHRGGSSSLRNSTFPPTSCLRVGACLTPPIPQPGRAGAGKPGSWALTTATKPVSGGGARSAPSTRALTWVRSSLKGRTSPGNSTTPSRGSSGRAWTVPGPRGAAAGPSTPAHSARIPGKRAAAAAASQVPLRQAAAGHAAQSASGRVLGAGRLSHPEHILHPRTTQVRVCRCCCCARLGSGLCSLH